MRKPFPILPIALVVSAMLVGFACSRQNTPNSAAYQDSVKQALEQADLGDVKVNEDVDKNTITLTGTLHSEDAKTKAADVAKSAGGARIIANEISVQPVGQESEAKEIASNHDKAIEKNYKAALISKGLDKQHIKYDSDNGVLTLKGTVKSTQERQEAQQLAETVPNVLQVVNQLEVKR